MDVREKLIDLLTGYSIDTQPDVEYVADHLITNGVTVQSNKDINVPSKWISVTESPKWKGCYIVAVNHWLDGKPVTREAYWNGCDWLSCDKKRELTPRVTHWMPLPEPPKGGMINGR